MGAQEKVTITNASQVVYVGQQYRKLVIYNLSQYDISIAFSGGVSAWLPAWTADLFTAPLNYDGSVTLAPQNNNSSSFSPSSYVLINTYLANDTVSGTFPVGLTRQVSLGNGINVINANAVIQSGETIVNDLVRANPSGFTQATVTIADDGSIILQPLSSGTQIVSFQAIAGNATTPNTFLMSNGTAQFTFNSDSSLSLNALNNGVISQCLRVVPGTATTPATLLFYSSGTFEQSFSMAVGTTFNVDSATINSGRFAVSIGFDTNNYIAVYGGNGGPSIRWYFNTELVLRGPNVQFQNYGGSEYIRLSSTGSPIQFNATNTTLSGIKVYSGVSTTTVTHGLGVAPNVVASYNDSRTPTSVLTVTSITSTQFTVICQSTYYWQALAFVP